MEHRKVLLYRRLARMAMWACVPFIFCRRHSFINVICSSLQESGNFARHCTVTDVHVRQTALCINFLDQLTHQILAAVPFIIYEYFIAGLHTAGIIDQVDRPVSRCLGSICYNLLKYILKIYIFSVAYYTLNVVFLKGSLFPEASMQARCLL